MRVDEVLNGSNSLSSDFAMLRQHCGQFLEESAGLPLFKVLPQTYSDFHRVKVRRQKRTDVVTEAFNRAFESQFANLRQRAIFAYGNPPITADHSEPFYVFPINGYKYLYSTEVKNSNSEYKTVIETMFETFDNNEEAIEIVTDLLKYTYHRSKLSEGIASESEIVIYGVPYYYAIRTSAVDSYKSVLDAIGDV